MLSAVNTGGAVNGMDWIGKKVRVKGEVGSVTSVEVAEISALKIQLQVLVGAPDRFIRVPQYEWGQLEVVEE